MEGDLTNWRIMGAGDISIHSLRMEGDQCIFKNQVLTGTFQSTPSAWRETWVQDEKAS